MTSLHPIGYVVAELSEEFPDVTPSKVRYLEAEGLIQPQRTPKGSRRYAAQDIDRLRRILRMQRDDFLPLAVISERLEAPEPGGPAADAPRVPVSRLRAGRPRRMSSAEVAQRGGVEPGTLRELVSSGLITEMDASAVEVCRAVSALAVYGIEPRHLRSFKAAADREIGLVGQALAPHRSSASATDVRERAAELLSLLLDLHVALLRQRSTTLDT